MLSNLKFVDPKIAGNISQLEEEMKSLIKSKLEIQDSKKISEETKVKLLKANQDERLTLRKVLEKCKLKMADYLDQQVEVTSKKCMLQGDEYVDRQAMSQKYQDKSTRYQQYENKSTRQQQYQPLAYNSQQNPSTTKSLISNSTPVPNQKQKLTTLIYHYQHPSHQSIDSNEHHVPEHQSTEQLLEVLELYRRKVQWLEVKCQSLEGKNQRLEALVEEQDQVIGRLLGEISEKNMVSSQIEVYSDQANIQQHQAQAQTQLSKANNSQQSNSLSYMSNHPSINNHLPLTHLPHQKSPPLLPHSILSNSLTPCSQLTSSHLMNSTPTPTPPQLLTLTKQLNQLQQTLTQIQNQNKELKAERSLLLKKVKI